MSRSKIQYPRGLADCSIARLQAELLTAGAPVDPREGERGVKKPGRQRGIGGSSQNEERECGGGPDSVTVLGPCGSILLNSNLLILLDIVPDTHREKELAPLTGFYYK